MASLNKPVIAVAPGHSFNSGATLLAASGIPLVNNGSKLAFNEATFGFVPHAGATYYLSRLPGEFGTFLALTGMRVDGSDAIAVGLAQGAVQDPLKMKEDVAEIVRSQEYRPRYGDEYFENNFKHLKWKEMHYNEP
jgi:enoyl-CoA hydratase/carnithine racemase